MEQEAALIARLQEDDKSALATVYTAYREAFVAYARQYELEEADCLDIYQDAIIAVYQNLVTKKITLQNSTLKTYLFGIGKYKILDRLKANKQLFALKNTAHDYEIVEEKTMELTLEQQQLATYFGHLGKRCQAILKMYYYQNWSIKEIVQWSHYKDENTVKSHKSRCLKQLKSIIKENTNK